MGEVRIGGRNNVLLNGREDKPVMMLANGFGCDQNMWRLVAPALTADFAFASDLAPSPAAAAVTAIIALLESLGDGRQDDTAVLALGVTA
jgi:pimeloyl-ACP methyl ester carboxylesterase